MCLFCSFYENQSKGLYPFPLCDWLIALCHWLYCALGVVSDLVWFGLCFRSVNVKRERLAVDLGCYCNVRGFIEQLYSLWHYKVNSVALTEFTS